ncbi:DUF6580 family putative transport protein [Leptospira sp. WS92.C1]
MQKIMNTLRNHKSNFRLNGVIPSYGVFLSGIARFLPHPANFTSVGAMAVYSGARLSGGKSFAYPIFMVLITDFILSRLHGFDWFYEGSVVNYISLTINILLGKFLLKKDSRLRSVAAVALLASVQFFILTNFSVWAFSSIYAKTWDGLLTCYIVAIPYFGGTLLGDLIYTPILFGVFDRIQLKINPGVPILFQKPKRNFPFESERITGQASE